MQKILADENSLVEKPGKKKKTEQSFVCLCAQNNKN